MRRREIMSTPKVERVPTSDDFGVAIYGVTRELPEQEGVRRQINDLFERRGPNVLRDIELTGAMAARAQEFLQ